MYKYVKFFKELTLGDVPQVGGKNASLGEMIKYLAPKGLNLPLFVNDRTIYQRISEWIAKKNRLRDSF